VFTACASHFLSQHPPPDTASWLEPPDPARRRRHGLAEPFASHDANREMIDRVLRDSEKVPVGGGFARLQAAAEALGEGCGGRGLSMTVGDWPPCAWPRPSPAGARWSGTPASAPIRRPGSWPP